MSKVHVVASQPSPTESVIYATTAFRGHPAFFRNSAISDKMLFTRNGFRAKNCSLGISEKCVESCTSVLLVIWEQQWVVEWSPVLNGAPKGALRGVRSVLFRERR